jgi:hypothetical protein
VTLVHATLVAIVFAIGGCASRNSDIDLCDAYIQTSGSRSSADAEWVVLSSPPTELMNSAAARLPRQYGIPTTETLDYAWYTGGTQRLGLCTLAGSPKCAMGFFVYPADGLNGNPTESTLSMSCGPM